mmetsp:Transcript_111772/g.193976  ORF Transcript_111772/g.193976 Transcript_111772/m.193976 type:complete len:226 (-) Transcript_111772:423-1100(-)
MPVQDPYSLLGVGRYCSEEELRRAYKLQALKYHPDKNPGGEEQFKQITEAYNLLADPHRRALYDQKYASKSPGSNGTRAKYQSMDEILRQQRDNAQRTQASVDEIIRKDQKVRAQSQKSLRELLQEQERMRRQAEQHRHMASTQGQQQARKVATLQDKFRQLNVPGVKWHQAYEEFTTEEAAERRQIVGQLISESDEDVDDIVLFRFYVSASEIIINRRGHNNYY